MVSVLASRVGLVFASLLSIADGVACSPSPTSLILDDPRPYAAKADLVVRARVDALVSERAGSGIERVDLTVLDGFKGNPPTRLLVRYSFHWCDGRPPLGEEVYLFVFSTPEASTASIAFIPAQRMPSGSAVRLGASRRPKAGTLRFPSSSTRLAPSEIDPATITRTEGDVIAESWFVNLPPVRQWAIPRFYIRVPTAFVFFEQEMVRKPQTFATENGVEIHRTEWLR